MSVKNVFLKYFLYSFYWFIFQPMLKLKELFNMNESANKLR